MHYVTGNFKTPWTHYLRN